MCANQRKYYRTTIILVLGNLLALTRGARGDDLGPVIRIPQGKLRGVPEKTWHGRSYTNFLGIPYAKPPIGDLRFEKPVRAEGWDGILIANNDGPDCIQQYNDDLFGSEDCLYLNVLTPELPDKKKSRLLPVMVYVFGGAFKIESRSSTRYSGIYLLQEDIVLIVPNYRLGPLGFLSTGDRVVPGNNGFKDIVLAFGWVQNNIEYFGGDPKQVTMVGHSSGAATAELLAMSPLMAGLFHRYISQSGSALSFWSYTSRDSYKQRAWKLGEYVGCSKNLSSTKLVQCLKGINATTLIATLPKFYMLYSAHPMVIWCATNEDESSTAFLTDNPRNILAAGKIHDVPFMTGVVLDEGLGVSTCLYNHDDKYNGVVSNLEGTLPHLMGYYHLPINQSAFTKEIIAYYLNDLTAPKSVILANLTRLFGDFMYMYPAWDNVQRHVSLTLSPTYFYTFNYLGTFSHTYVTCGHKELIGIAHGDELNYIFDEYGYSFTSLNKSISESDYEMTRKLVSLWTSFVKHGIPSTSADPEDPVWTPYVACDNNILRIGNGASTAFDILHSLHTERVQFWDEMMAKFF